MWGHSTKGWGQGSRVCLGNRCGRVVRVAEMNRWAELNSLRSAFLHLFGLPTEGDDWENTDKF